MATLELAWAALGSVEGETEQAARRGDRAAWSALVERHNHRVVLALIASGVLSAQARDLAQEAWLRLMSQAASQKLDRLLLPGLVIRQALFLARTQARREGPPPEAPADEVEPSAEQRFLSAERLRRATQVLATCSQSAQRVFRLIYTQPSLSHAEVAARVGLSVQRVRQIICEVRKKLRGSLEGEFDA